MPQNLLSFVMVLSAVTLVPGPNVVVVIRNTLQGGIGEGTKTILGNLLALLCMAALAAFGLGSIFLLYPASLTTLQALGAAYLLYVSWKLYRSGRQQLTCDGIEMSLGSGAGSSNSLKDGLFVSFSNPKAILFLMSVLPQHIGLGDSRVQQFTILFTALACVVFSIHFGYALFGSLLRKSQHFKLVMALTNLTAATLLLVFFATILITLLGY